VSRTGRMHVHCLQRVICYNGLHILPLMTHVSPRRGAQRVNPISRCAWFLEEILDRSESQEIGVAAGRYSVSVLQTDIIDT
jgi:hypothetical protein